MIAPGRDYFLFMRRLASATAPDTISFRTLKNSEAFNPLVPSVWRLCPAFAHLYDLPDTSLSQVWQKCVMFKSPFQRSVAAHREPPIPLLSHAFKVRPFGNSALSVFARDAQETIRTRWCELFGRSVKMMNSILQLNEMTKRKIIVDEILVAQTEKGEK